MKRKRFARRICWYVGVRGQFIIVTKSERYNTIYIYYICTIYIIYVLHILYIYIICIIYIYNIYTIYVLYDLFFFLYYQTQYRPRLYHDGVNVN